MMTETPEPLIGSSEWMRQGACVGQPRDMWFPTPTNLKATRDAARAICDGCDVKERCLDFAMDNDIRHGMWGGLTEKERDRKAKGLPIIKRRKDRGRARASKYDPCGQPCDCPQAGATLCTYCGSSFPQDATGNLSSTNQTPGQCANTPRPEQPLGGHS